MPGFSQCMPVIKENVPLAPYTYFKIGGPARYFAEVTSEEDLEEAITFVEKEQAPFFVLGSGSNILVSDKGFPGLVIKMNLGKLAVREGGRVVAGAGVPMACVVRESVKNSLTGFEWAIGVPGSIGGSVRGNAGYAGIEMKDVVKDVAILDVAKTKRSTLNTECCIFGYRDSVFKKHPEWIILSATLTLQKGDPKKSQELVKEHIRLRRETQDVGAQCAGSMFKNPDASHATIAPAAGAVAVRAGWLIDQAGLKGYRVGNAVVSPRHANFMVNTGGATAEEVIMLIGIVKEYVHRKFGVFLEEEIQYVGF